MSKPFYFLDPEIGCFNYSSCHPMKPQRVQMTHELVKVYGLEDKLDIRNYSTLSNCPKVDFTRFHTDEYVEFLKKITLEETALYCEEINFFNFDDNDCPIFDNIFDYCQSYTTGTVMACENLMETGDKIAINWSGGLHHAKKNEASGFCYINDCVLGILDLLRQHNRVLYIDIDVHHGDGVEEAFYCTDRVMTCSFHKYGDFFPGTGALEDIGFGQGKGYSVNVPLKEGVDDVSFELLFKNVIDNIIEKFRPDAVMLQCGSDSLSGDRLGCFNLSVKGHAKAVEYIKSKNLPTVYLGGGGYTLRNVPRCWTYETAVLLGAPVEDAIPQNVFSEYFYPDYSLHIPTTNMENMNDADYLHSLLEGVDSNLKTIIQPYNSFSLDENYAIPKINNNE